MENGDAVWRDDFLPLLTGSAPPVATAAAAETDAPTGGADRYVYKKALYDRVRQRGDGLCLWRALEGAGQAGGDTKKAANSKQRMDDALKLKSTLLGHLVVRQPRTRVHVAAPACCSTTFVSRPCS